LGSLTRVQESEVAWPQRDGLAGNLVPILAMEQHRASLDRHGLVGFRIFEEHPFLLETLPDFRARQHVVHDILRETRLERLEPSDQPTEGNWSRGPCRNPPTVPVLRAADSLLP